MCILYKRQEEVKDLIIEGLTGSIEIEERDLIILTGEVGSGKTYIASKVIKELGLKTLIILPNKQLKSKWEEVLDKFGCENYSITVRFNSDMVQDYDFVVYDEVHTVKSKLTHFTEYFELNEHRNQRKKFLGLTGSAINKYINEFTDFFNFYEKYGIDEFYSYNEYKNEYKEFNVDRYDYINKFIKYVFTVGLNKDQIDELIDDEVTIETIIHDIDMDASETAFYKFLLHRIKGIGLSRDKTIYYLNKYLDRETYDDLYITYKNKKYYAGDPLHDENGEKINVLKNIIKDKTGIIVYTFSDKLAQKLGDGIENLTFIDTVVPKDLDNNPAIELINETLKTTNVVINIENVLLGFDIESNTAVFYQTPEDLETNIQAIGRITRLHNSNQEKTVHYIYHNNTIQEETIKRIEKNNNTNNNLIEKSKKDHIDTIFGIPVVK